MAKYKVMLGILCVGGSYRHEVGHFLKQAALTAQADDRFEDLLEVPIARVPTPVARNLLVSKAREHGCDFLFMVDEDMAPNAKFFLRAFEFLVANPEAAAVGSPYCTAPPREDVLAFEWAAGESRAPQAAWAVTNIVREDAARREGIEEVANIGTGVIAYRVAAFDKLDQPYFDYAYADDEHIQVVETEDCYAHRKLWFAGLKLYCDWESWASHWKLKQVQKPIPITRDEIMRTFQQDRQAGIKHRRRLEEQSGEAKKSDEAIQLYKVPGAFGPTIEEPLFPSESAAQAAYTANLTRVLPAPKLEPQTEPFTAEQAVAFAASVPGWMSDGELWWLAERAAELPFGGHWVEVGSWKGRSFAATALAATTNAYLFAVDTWQGSLEELEYTHKEAAEAPQKVFDEFMDTKENVGWLRRDLHLNITRLSSVEAADEFQDGSLDVCFIDAAHDLKNVAADLRSWLRKVKPGGLICGHDRDVPDVQEALHRNDWGLKFKSGPGGIWYARVPAHSEANGKVPVLTVGD